jgi:hypothetical protein
MSAGHSYRLDHAPGLSQGMRASRTVLKRLAAPRGERLSSVLSTLQPDQHALVA